jgi:hypothetical protein
MTFGYSLMRRQIGQAFPNRLSYYSPILFVDVAEAFKGYSAPTNTDKQRSVGVELFARIRRHEANK